MFGYWDIGSVSNETNPTTTVMMAMTMATMGRRMKNLDIRYLPLDCGACETTAFDFEISGVMG